MDTVMLKKRLRLRADLGTKIRSYSHESMFRYSLVIEAMMLPAGAYSARQRPRMDFSGSWTCASRKNARGQSSLQYRLTENYFSLRTRRTVGNAWEDSAECPRKIRMHTAWLPTCLARSASLLSMPSRYSAT